MPSAPTKSPAVDAAVSADERAAAGKAAREKVSRSSHGDWERPARRRDPVKVLEDQAKSRVQELVPIRYGRMLASPFTFFRGAAPIMAMDLAKTPQSGIQVQLCGDAHLSNFGVFAAPDRRLVLDVNDFDDTLPGPWEWDVKRLAASFVLAGRDNGFSTKERTRVLALLGEYRSGMHQFAAMTNLAVWYSHIDVKAAIKELRKGVSAAVRKRTEANVAKARTRDSLQAFDKLTRVVGGQRRISSDPPLVQPIDELFGEMERHQIHDFMRAVIRRYRRTLPSDRRHLLEDFRLADVARKVVGVGSVGTRAWIVLMLGRDDTDPLFLQAKEAEASVLEEFVGRSDRRSHGQRVVHGQHLMQASSDIFLGWDHAKGYDGVERDFYVRQLRDWKGAALVATMTPATMAIYARICASALVRAHARSGDRIAIASYLGSNDAFDRALVEFSEAYADQNNRDYNALVQAEKNGRITAQHGI